MSSAEGTSVTLMDREVEGKFKEYEIGLETRIGRMEKQGNKPERKPKPTVWRVWTCFGRKEGDPLEVSEQLGDMKKE